MEKLVEYYVTNDAISVFVIGRSLPQNLASIRIEFKYTALRALVAAFREALIHNRDYRPVAADLYALLIAPLIERGLISASEGLYIAPHRCLHSLPFQALGHDRDILLQTHSIAYLPVGSTILRFSSATRKAGGCLVVLKTRERDNPLLQQSFRREAETVATQTSGELLSEKDATLSRIKQCLAGKSMVHFTCHGTFDERAPFRSGILLCDDEGEERLVGLDEISKLPLDVDLVVLAGCDTGLSERHAGDEMDGLVRAVLSAGARSVLATLWPVHSVSTELLVHKFYQEYLAGKTKTESTRLAQLFLQAYPRSELTTHLERELTRAAEQAGASLLQNRLADLQRDVALRASSVAVSSHSEDYPFSHPYYWSGFNLIGGWQ